MTQARRWVAKDFAGPEVLVEIAVKLPGPAPGEVTVEVRAAGMNPADYKHSALTAPVSDVFAKPSTLSFQEAANLLLAGTTAAETLHVIDLSEGETMLVHGAAGAVGTSVVQQARLLGASVIGTASERDFDAVRGFGATPVRYGPGLEERVREAAASGVDAAVDTVGVDEAIDVSLALVSDRRRIVSTAAFGRAPRDGFQTIGAANPDSGPFRAAARKTILDLAERGKLTVPIGATFPLSDAPRAVEALAGQHPYGKLALVP